MPSSQPSPRRIDSRVALAGLALALGAQAADAQQLTEPVYRVENAAVTTAQSQQGVATNLLASSPVEAGPLEPDALGMIDRNVRPASAEAPAGPFDLNQRPGEHPLMPLLRVSQTAIERMDQEVTDYTATFTKVERLEGELGQPQQIQLRIRHQPFSVYLKFVQPKPGQEVLYVADRNDGKLVALASGWKRRIGLLNLDPTGSMAMADQRYPITRIGIRNLIARIVRDAESDTKYAECEVTHNDSVVIAGRPVTMVEIVHPVPRKNFKHHKAQVFFDHELQLPVAYRAYSWPAQEGAKAPLEEQYIYTNIKLNNGFSDTDFSTDNPSMFN